MANTNYDLSTFSKGGKIEDVKIGTKVWFKSPKEIDVGVVTEKEYKEPLGYVAWVKWTDWSTLCLSYNDFNDCWGIIAENKQEQNRHKYYDVILHWANGGEIQHLADGIWLTFTGELTPAFFSYEWRIKPKTKTIRYRCALLKDNEIIALTSEPTLEDAYGDTAFLRWIDPEWKEIEVEI